MLKGEFPSAQFRKAGVGGQDTDSTHCEAVIKVEHTMLGCMLCNWVVKLPLGYSMAVSSYTDR